MSRRHNSRDHDPFKTGIFSQHTCHKEYKGDLYQFRKLEGDTTDLNR